MILKFIFYAVIFFFLVRFINRLFLPSNKRQQNFNPFTGNSHNNSNSGNRSFDQIEDAEYEDISDKDQ